MQCHLTVVAKLGSNVGQANEHRHGPISQWPVPASIVYTKLRSATGSLLTSTYRHSKGWRAGCARKGQAREPLKANGASGAPTGVKARSGPGSVAAVCGDSVSTTK